MEKHTPWQLLESLNMWYVRNSLGEFVLPAGAGSNYYPTIVEAVNNHDALTSRVKELEKVINEFVINEKQINDPLFKGFQARLMDMARKALDKEATK